MSSLTIGFLPSKCCDLISALARNQVPEVISDPLKRALTTSYEDGSPNNTQVVEEKQVAEIFIDTVEKLKRFLAKSSVSEVEAVEENSNYCKLLSVLEDGKTVTLQFTVPEDPEAQEWTLSSIVWEDNELKLNML